MTPDQGFMAASAPAERVAFSTKSKASVEPSGEKAACWKMPLRWVSCFDSPVAREYRNICGWLGSLVQVLVKARVLESGDHTGEPFEQSDAPATVTTFSFPKGLARSRRFNDPPPRPPSVHASIAPSGEIATWPGARRRPPVLRMAASR